MYIIIKMLLGKQNPIFLMWLGHVFSDKMTKGTLDAEIRRSPGYRKGWKLFLVA
jgi:hypothetical protein